MLDVLTAGDTVDFVTSLPDYPASDGWELSFRLVPATGSAIDITTIAAGDDHRAVNTAANSANWVPGSYTWYSYVTLGAVRHKVAEGQCVIKPDPAQLDAYDGRSQARIALAAVDAVIANRATLDQKSYSIGGRSLERMAIGELLQLQSHLRIEVRREDAASRRARGMDDGRRIYLRAARA